MERNVSEYKKIAEAQLDIAIELYLTGRCFISSLTLAGAAEEILGKFIPNESDRALNRKKDRLNSLYKVILKALSKPEEEIKINLNEAKNAVKHPKEILPDFDYKQEAKEMIERAIENYRKVFGLKVPQSIKSFENDIYDNIKSYVRSENVRRSVRLSWLDFVIEAVKRRKEQKLTQEQLAVLAGVSKPTLNSFEQGKTTVKLESALKILKVLGLS